MIEEREVLKLSAVVVAGTITAMLDMTMVAVALAGLSRAFDVPVATVQWVNTAYLLTIAMVIPLTGRLAERYGTRVMWLWALAVFIAGSALCGTAWNAGSLIAFRALQGVGGGMIVPLGLMILATAAGESRRGRVMAVAAVPAQLAPIAGPLLGGLIVDGAGWRWIFFLNVPVGLVALLLSYRTIPAAPPAAAGVQGVKRRLDLPGVALLCPGLALVVYALSRTGDAASPVAWWPPLAIGAALLVAFALHARRAAMRTAAAAPLLDLRLFRHRPLAAATTLNFISRLSIFGALMLIPLYHQQVAGHSALEAGLLLAPQSLGTMLALPQVGRLTDRLGARPVVLAGIAVSTAGALVYTRLAADPGPLLLAVALLVWGAGIAAVAVPVSAAAYQGLEPSAIPAATSAITMVQTVGASVGAAVLAAILQHLLARHPGAPAAAYAGTFWWVLAFTALTVVPALLLPLRPPSAARAELG
ncbi:DHA2 family efflux MFS transporter permease subunit [Dactylosporangium sp. NPDC000244]|uniref:DHA2 family efflux MFS transporter permease subunit n=1 Tax=Dactylosporangium sp. NPDC000244 TaxID=3154365 RepID=UPI0033301E92